MNDSKHIKSKQTNTNSTTLLSIILATTTSPLMTSWRSTSVCSVMSIRSRAACFVPVRSSLAHTFRPSRATFNRSCRTLSIGLVRLRQCRCTRWSLPQLLITSWCTYTRLWTGMGELRDCSWTRFSWSLAFRRWWYRNNSGNVRSLTVLCVFFAW